jgi:hypothetical protein
MGHLCNTDAGETSVLDAKQVGDGIKIQYKEKEEKSETKA